MGFSVVHHKARYTLTRLLSSIALLGPLPLAMGHTTNRLVLYSLSVFFSFGIGLLLYHLGQVFDRRLRVYYKVNSALDKVLYRVLVGLLVIMGVANIASLLPSHWSVFVPWVVWSSVLLSWAWPTSSKVIHDQLSAKWREFHFLDAFEKIALLLVLLFFTLSFPEVPRFEGPQLVSLYLDSAQTTHSMFWELMRYLLFPLTLQSSAVVSGLGMAIASYMCLGALGLLSCYCLCRLVYSRRMAMLGVLAFVSTWSFSKLIEADFSWIVMSTFPLVWIWSSTWVLNSATYRSGLLCAIVGVIGVSLSPVFAFLYPLQVVACYLLYRRTKTPWFCRQFLKYSLGAVPVVLGLLIFGELDFANILPMSAQIGPIHFYELWERKAFFILSLWSIVLTVRGIALKRREMLIGDRELARLYPIAIHVGLLILLRTWSDPVFFSGFVIIWSLAFLSLFPLEVFTRWLRRSRSTKNLLYLVYILICLLDSHLEGRVKILFSLIS